MVLPGNAHPPGYRKGGGRVIPGNHHRDDARPFALQHGGAHAFSGRVLHADEPAEHQLALNLPVVAGEMVHVLIGHGQHPQGLFR